MIWGETMTAPTVEDVLCSLRKSYSLRYVVRYIKMQLLIKTL